MCALPSPILKCTPFDFPSEVFRHVLPRVFTSSWKLWSKVCWIVTFSIVAFCFVPSLISNSANFCLKKFRSPTNFPHVVFFSRVCRPTLSRLQSNCVASFWYYRSSPVRSKVSIVWFNQTIVIVLRIGKIMIQIVFDWFCSIIFFLPEEEWIVLIVSSITLVRAIK